MIQSLPNKPIQKPSTGQAINNPPSSYGRLNEPLLTGRRTNRLSRGSRGMGLTGKKHYVVEQDDREAWVFKFK